MESLLSLLFQETMTSSVPHIQMDLSQPPFQLPMLYHTEHVRQVPLSAIDELELSTAKEVDGTPVYPSIFPPTSRWMQRIVADTATVHTTNALFLTDTQRWISESTSIPWADASIYEQLDDVIKESYEGHDVGFRENYGYMEWSLLEPCNENEWFLMASGIHTLCAPLQMLLYMVFVILGPFFMIRAQGMCLSWQSYQAILWQLIQQNMLGKLLSGENIAYSLVSLMFFVYSLYHQVMSSVRFYQQRTLVHRTLYQWKLALERTVQRELETLKQLQAFPETYGPFCESFLRPHILLCTEWTRRLSIVSSSWNWLHMGHLMKLFYQLHFNPQCREVLHGARLCHGYLDMMSVLHRQVHRGVLTKATFVQTAKEHCMKGLYYPVFLSQSTGFVPNDVSLAHSLVITGPNASGKTTLLKSVFISTLMSLQFGFGCFHEARIPLYSHLHCYLNIPDTSGRDSLFQAEARRCQQILTKIEEHDDNKELHFAIFDELFSGTNPDEAAISMVAYMRYLKRFARFRCLLSTHYTSACPSLAKSANMRNWRMTPGDFVLSKGISYEKGAWKVLTLMNFPQEMLSADNFEKKKST